MHFCRNVMGFCRNALVYFSPCSMDCVSMQVGRCVHAGWTVSPSNMDNFWDGG